MKRQLWISLRALLIAAVVCMATSGNTNAAVVEGDLLGVFDGVSSPSQILADLGLDVIALDKVEAPDTSDGNLILSDIVFDDEGEPLSGRWDYLGDGLVDLLVVKADGHYAAYRYTDDNTDNMRNMGLWDVADIAVEANKVHGMSYVAAYQVHHLPEPSSVILLVIGLASIAGLAAAGRHSE